ncbi:MAG: hypothetical protein ACMXX8_00765 [Candidatus Woesearchaeota archaeon]
MKAKIIVIFMLLFLLVGCRGFSRSEEGDVNYRRGTTGLELRFLDRSPPYYVYEGDYLNIIVELYNRGASGVYGGELYITGYDPNLIGRYGASGFLGIPPPGTPHRFELLDKKTQFNREGGYDMLEFTSGELYLAGIDKYKIPLTVYACYEYETIANTEICMDPEPHRPPSEKPCYTKNPAMGGGQAAPVAVTNIDLTNMRNSMRITFTISDLGNGNTIDLSRKQQGACPTGFGPADVDVVYLEHVKVGDQTINCNPDGRIKLVNGVGRVSCTAPIPSGTAYTTPLEIILYYGYRTHIRREVEIRGFY